VLKIKNSNNTFLVKIIGKLIGKMKRQTSYYNLLIELCQDIIKFCEDSSNVSMKNKIQTRLCQLHLINGNYKPGLELITKTLYDLKKYDDNLGLIEIQLIESKIHFCTMAMGKSKVKIILIRSIGCTYRRESFMHKGLY